MKSFDNAVSPVLGVIVMIAITVILAATVAFFIFGMANGTTHQKSVAATAVQISNDQIIVTYLGGQDANDCTKIKVTINTPSGAVQSQQIAPGVGAVMPGSRLSFQTDYSGKDRVMITAIFRDGTEQLIYDNVL